jgi:Na+/H+ antiporter NhaD/arsenite permease-like protein
MSPEQILAIVIFIGTLVLIVSNKVEKSVAAIFGGMLMILTGVIQPEEVVTQVDWNVLGLLTGLMMTVGYFSKSGVPIWIAQKIIRALKGNVRLTLTIMCFMGSFLSCFIDNTTTMLALSTLTLELAIFAGIRKAYVLIPMAISVNITGYATLISDPPAVFLGSFGHLTLPDFFIYNGAPSFFFYALLSAISGTLYLYYFFGKQIKKPKVEVTGTSSLENKNLAKAATTGFILLCVLIGFRSVTHIPESVVALFIASIFGVICSRIAKSDVVEMFSFVDWSTILFLTGMFIMVGGLNVSGVIQLIADSVVALAGGKIVMIVIFASLFTLLTCAFIINIPYLITMIYVMQGVGATIGVDPVFLYLVVMFAGYAGSTATMIAAPSNIVAVGLCKKEGDPVSFKDFSKVGIPFAISTFVPPFIILVLRGLGM